MFVGTFEHALDDKGRVVVPSAFRARLAEGGFVAKLERALGLWLPEGFESRVEDLRVLVRDGALGVDELRTYLAEAHEVHPDSQGRIFLPATLRLHAGLEDQIVFNGFGSRLEIWQETRWRQVHTGGDDAAVEAIEAAVL